MKHIVIGGDGFLGAVFVRTLIASGQQVMVVDIKQQNRVGLYPQDHYINVDIVDRSAVSRIPIAADDIVYNLAARIYDDGVPRNNVDAWFNRVNVEGHRNVLDQMQSVGCTSMVFVSTDMIYGKPQSTPITTDHPKRPIGAYGRSKVLAEEVTASYRQSGFRITVFRPRVIIGRGRLGLFEKLFHFMERDWPVPVFGNGRNTYQMISVDDCAAAMLAAVRAGLPSKDYNLGSDAYLPVEDLLTALMQRIGSHSRLVRIPSAALKLPLSLLERLGLPVMVKEQYELADATFIVDTKETKEDLDWRPMQADVDALADAWTYFVEKRGP